MPTVGKGVNSGRRYPIQLEVGTVVDSEDFLVKVDGVHTLNVEVIERRREVRQCFGSDALRMLIRRCALTIV